MGRLFQLSSLFSLLCLASASPTVWERHRGDPCPAPCGLTGPSPEDWGVYYYGISDFNRCDRPMLVDFMVDAPLSQSGTPTKVRACSIWGTSVPSLNVTASTESSAEGAILQRLELSESVGASHLAARLVSHLQKHLYTYTQPTGSFIRFARIGHTTVGFFGGRDMDVARTSEDILSSLIKHIIVDDVSHGVLEQICGPGRGSRHTWGIVVAFDDTFSIAQQAVKSWSDGQCAMLGNSSSTQTQSTPVPSPSSSPSSSLSLSSYHGQTRNVTIYTTPNDAGTRSTPRYALHRRADCTTIQVDSGDSCGSLATRCGISGADFTKYNSDEDLCSTLVPGQHVCCSSGTLPSFAPEPNEDGTCATYVVQEDDSCSKIAATNDLTADDLEDFNKNTWGWNGCSLLWVGTKMCLSTGRPPMPAPIANAICGPQVPDTEEPDDDTDLADLNPCPLNACCNIWGQCGITAEFCTISESESGAPGTSAPGENGCISNCGMEVIKSEAPDSFIRIGYFQGYNLDRECQYMDARQIDSSKYTHIHFGFGTMTESYDVMVGNTLAQFEFEQFKQLSGVKRILSMGGWAFSTEPATYMIFRNGVQAANRNAMAQKIADFVIEHDLDGIDIDWEYPGAPDIPGIPPGAENEGNLYTAFLALLKSKLPGKSISIAAPASYWYLKQYPIDKMVDLVDYVVFMAYDLHGQWDFANQWSSPGCPEGNCLRSHVNLTETHNALSMITKAGADSNKLIVGVASYGRAFKMSTAGCTGPECTFAGEASGAKKGRCTGEAGYISNGEIQEILDNNENSRTFVDDSFSNILVYDDTEWVAYSDDSNREARETLFQGLNMGGSVEWAVDLQAFHDVPDNMVEVVDGVSVPIKSWASVKSVINLGNDPYTWGERTGNWTELDCNADAVRGKLQMPSDERWEQLGCADAWDDAIRTWKTDYKPHGRTFSESIFDFFNAEAAECGLGTEEGDCDDAINCEDTKGSGSGPAGWEILNSLIKINSMLKDYYQAIKDASDQVTNSDNSDKFIDTFAPVQDHTTAFNVLMDMLGIIVPSVAAPAFNSVLRNMNYFTRHPGQLDTAKDISYTLVGGWVNLAKDTNPGDYDWDEDDSAEFKLWMTQSFELWMLSADAAAQDLFNGTDESIEILSKAIKNGQLIDGLIEEGDTVLPALSREEQKALVMASFYSYTIPQVWQESSHSVFWLDPGDHDCDDDSNPADDYIFDSTAEVAKACYNGKAYYLVYPEGSASNSCQTPGGGIGVCVPYKFDPPPGIESLGSYDVKLDDILASSLRSFDKHGGNGWDLQGIDDIDENSFRDQDLIDEDVGAAGRNRIPICSAEEAFLNWGDSSSAKNYPCD
ncbi:hypothetical protein BDW74DRAFT_156203 [Aspergillus multicolor]|uniref:uncharacterized protein n=1 Tax=Aspergillus multicolor TaxID=41759 RepID=UPI003CCD3245